MYVYAPTLGLVSKEIVNFAGCSVVCDDSKTFVVHVEDKILALHTEFNVVLA